MLIFAAPATVCKLAGINANDLDKVLNLTSPGLLCSLPKTEHRTNEIKCVLGARGVWPPWHLWGVSVLMIYTATKTSENLQLRVIFTASFQCCKWASLGCLMGGRGAEESEEMPLCWLRWENDTRFEKRDSTPLFLVCWEDSLNTSVWFSELSPQSRGWVTQAPSLRRVSQFPRFIYYWLPWKQGQRLLNRRLCWGTHPRCTSALLKSAVIVQWWWINCRWIHICPYNQRPSFLFPPGNNILWLCIHRVIRVGVSFHLPCAHCKCLPCLLLDKLSCWACLKARPSQGILKAICCVPHPCSLVKCQKLQFWCGKTPWKAVVNPPW